MYKIVMECQAVIALEIRNPLIVMRNFKELAVEVVGETTM